MSVLTSFESFVRAFLLVVVTFTIAKRKFPSFFEQKEGITSLYYKLSVIGERMSLYIGIMLFYFGVKKIVNFFV
ncbi:ksh1 [Ecytonucleospora hepatopenaei]|uniref:Ksh1 n=1 Tax=Ecytonucleospora hepatopenaei TaxID=646526 RepID=A0A1W0E7V2_9MICR|nr:ksh1 [Ecytonucleospora hepatopenaei]